MEWLRRIPLPGRGRETPALVLAPEFGRIDQFTQELGMADVPVFCRDFKGYIFDMLQTDSVLGIMLFGHHASPEKMVSLKMLTYVEPKERDRIRASYFSGVDKCTAKFNRLPGCEYVNGVIGKYVGRSKPTSVQQDALMDFQEWMNDDGPKMPVCSGLITLK